MQSLDATASRVQELNHHSWLYAIKLPPQTMFPMDMQPVPSVSGHVDSAVLERMGKIMSYMRVSAGKPNKKPKKKDKLAALHGMGSTGGTNFPIVHGTDNIMPKPAGNSLQGFWQSLTCAQFLDCAVDDGDPAACSSPQDQT